MNKKNNSTVDNKVMPKKFAFHLKENKATKSNNEDKKYRAVLEALATDVVAYYVIEWDSGECLEFYVEDRNIMNMIDQMKEYMNYKDAIEKVYSGYIVESERKAILDKLSIESVRKELSSKDIYEVPVRRKINHRVYHILMTYRKMSDDYGKKAFILIPRNMSDIIEKEIIQQRKLEDALKKANEASESKTNFLFNMSHDIRTPMNAILGFAGVAKKYIDDRERALDSLEKLESAGEHLQRLINDMLDMARIESGISMLNPSVYNLANMVKEIEHQFAFDMQKKDIEFKVVCDIQDEVAVFDRLRLEQIELNLISNALKYTEKGGKVTYRVTQEDRQNDIATYKFVIEDNGLGMTEEFLEHVFDRFTREQSSTISKIQGNGLGLAITKSLIEQMGGTIECKSEKSIGTTFTFELKLPINASDISENYRKIDISKVDFASKKLLVVEDNDLNREIILEILLDYGVVVDTAEDGQIAVDRIKEVGIDYYDMILMDIQMPVLNGYEATEIIRELEIAKSKKLPIIALTANAFDEDCKKALESGMSGHVAKPIDISKLEELFYDYLR